MDAEYSDKIIDQEPLKNEEASLRSATIEIIEALNNMDNKALDKYVINKYAEFWINGEGLNYAAMYLETYWNPYDITHPIYNLEFDKLRVNILNQSAIAKGYLSGNITYQDSSTETGPWRFAAFWIKVDETWKVEHVNISKMAVPQLQYFTQLPKEYDGNSDKKWPLIIYLHGIGERGSKIRAVRKLVKRRVGIPKIAAETEGFPFIAITPMCPWGSCWDEITYSLDDFLDEVIEQYKIDSERIYLTGMSMGGEGTWEFAMHSPHRLAAIAPVCSGTVDVSRLKLLSEVPVWVFHGAKDEIFPIQIPTNIVEELKACGGDVKFTVYPDLDHYIWDPTYDNLELYTWFLEHRRDVKV